jgi:lysophospholipase L1-like esterase
MHRILRLALVVTVALAASGCDYVKDKLSSPTSPTPVGPPATGAAISYTAMGASDALGVGGSVQCGLFAPCDNGTGYVQVAARELRAQAHDVSLINLGIPAAVLSPTIQRIARDRGRDVPANFVDQEMAFLAPGATLVSVFGGANDANALGYALQQGAGGADVNGYIDAQVRAFGADYDHLVQGIRSRAPGAYVVILNVPNLALMPYASGYSLAERQALQRIAVGFNREANRQAGSGVSVIDLMCDAGVYDRSRVSSDGFHPNDAGYAYLAQRLLAVINGASSSPASACSQMQAVS